jgi:DHA3 family macrolide efflux protein-like MFS transporter
VDRWNRRLVMIVADGVTALASLWLAYLFLQGTVHIWHVYASMFVRAVGASFHWPAMQSSTSLMVPKTHLTRVAGLNQTMYGMLNIVGPPLGALLMAALPLYGVMLVDVGTALLAIAPLVVVHIPQPDREDLAQDGSQGPSVWSDMRAGLRYIGAWPGLVALIASAMIIKIALTPAFALVPLLVSSHFGGDAAQLSVLEAAIGGGIVAGGLALSIWGGFRRRIYTTLMGAAVLGFGFVVLGLTPGNQFWMALASVFVVGLMIPLVDGPIMAILQGTVEPAMQGRVLTIMGSLLWLTSPLSLAVAGPISDRLGLQVWYLAAGLICLGLGVIGFFLPAITNIEENHKGRHIEEPQRLAPAVDLNTAGPEHTGGVAC